MQIAIFGALTRRVSLSLQLTSTSSPLKMSEPLLGFKAGRAFRREGTNFVDPDPTKGAILLSNGEDGLLHFIWKNRTTNEVEEVSMLIFVHV
jgi:hypothetical protein